RRLCAPPWKRSSGRRCKSGAVLQCQRRLPRESSGAGGDVSLSLAIHEPQLLELAPPTLLREDGKLAFPLQRLPIDARNQALAALLGHSLRHNVAEALEAESLALTLVQRALGPRTAHATGASVGRQRLADRVKLVLASDLSRRWTLTEIAAQVGGSPVYLT